MNTWRLLDMPPLSAADNMCLNQVLMEMKGEGRSQNTLRFLQFAPRTVLVGYHQSLREEIRVEYCRQNGIDINRRITGGGALYFDENQLGWEIYADKSFFGLSLPTQPLFERLCAPTVTALKRLGLPGAAFRPRNDIEVNGRKISGTGGAESGAAFMFQGTLLVDFDVDTMLRALRIPTEKLKDKEIDSIRQRVTCLGWELGRTPAMPDIKSSLARSFEEHLGIRLVTSGLTDEERKRFENLRDWFRSEAWINKVAPKTDSKNTVQAAYKAKAGMIRFSLVVDTPARRLRDIYITGDFLTFPGRALYDLEAELRGKKLDRQELRSAIKDYFDSGRLVIPGMVFEDFVKPLDQALAKAEIARLGLGISRAGRISVTNGTFAGISDQRPSVLLLPYCAKPVDCDLRRAPGCAACGRDGCTVGRAWEMGREMGLRPVTIVNYESLWQELMRMKRRGEKAFVGLCCQAFHAKHVDDFERAGVPGILLDIDDTTCYELGRAREAYAGGFENQTKLDLTLLRDVLRILPS